jgi:hypothetical protein
MKPKEIISQELLKELFEYHDGMLIRKINASNNALKGSIAGSPHSNGYRAIRINKQSYLEHRIIWVLLKGEIPEGAQVDHRDGGRNNNHIENLRLAVNGQSDNNQNTKVYKNNKSGYIGVRWHKQTSKWCAQIRIKGKAIHLGLFDTPEEASEAYLAKKKELHDFNPIPRPAALGADR